ncbi:hypothetical protein ABBQ32_000797 [Trebouxia sp. C0010 RCD-2024]
MGIVEGVVMEPLEVVMGGSLGLVGVEGGSGVMGVAGTEIWEEEGVTLGVVTGVEMGVEGTVMGAERMEMGVEGMVT